MSDKLLRSIVGAIGRELVKQSKATYPVGSQEFHIEALKRMPDDNEGAFQFEVTLWSELNDVDPRATEVIDYPALVNLIATTVADCCLSEICGIIQNHKGEIE